MWIARLLGKALLVLLAIPLGGLLLLVAYVVISSHWDIFQRSHPIAVTIDLEIDGRPLRVDRVARCEPFRVSDDIIPVFKTYYRLDRPDIGLRFEDGSGLILLPPDICWQAEKPRHWDRIERIVWLDNAARPTTAEVYNQPEVGKQPEAARIRFLGMDVNPAPSTRPDPEPVMAFVPGERDPWDWNATHAYFSGMQAARITDEAILRHPLVQDAIASHPGEVVQISRFRDPIWMSLWKIFSAGGSGVAIFATRLDGRSLHPDPSSPGVVVLYPTADLWNSPCPVTPSPSNSNLTRPLSRNPNALIDLKLSPEQSAALDCGHHSYGFTTIEVGGASVALDLAASYTLVFDPKQNEMLAFHSGEGLILVLPK